MPLNMEYRVDNQWVRAHGAWPEDIKQVEVEIIGPTNLLAGTQSTWNVQITNGPASSIVWKIGTATVGTGNSFTTTPASSFILYAIATVDGIGYTGQLAVIVEPIGADSDFRYGYGSYWQADGPENTPINKGTELISNGAVGIPPGVTPILYPAASKVKISSVGTTDNGHLGFSEREYHEFVEFRVPDSQTWWIYRSVFRSGSRSKGSIENTGKGLLIFVDCEFDGAKVPYGANEVEADYITWQNTGSFGNTGKYIAKWAWVGGGPITFVRCHGYNMSEGAKLVRNHQIIECMIDQMQRKRNYWQATDFGTTSANSKASEMAAEIDEHIDVLQFSTGGADNAMCIRTALQGNQPGFTNVSQCIIASENRTHSNVRIEDCFVNGGQRIFAMDDPLVNCRIVGNEFGLHFVVSPASLPADGTGGNTIQGNVWAYSGLTPIKNPPQWTVVAGEPLSSHSP